MCGCLSGFECVLSHVILWFLCCGLSVISVVFHMQTHTCTAGPPRGEYKRSLYSLPCIRPTPLHSTLSQPILSHPIPSQFHIIAFAHQRHVHWMYLYTGICPASCRCVCRAEKTFSRINFRIFRLACAWRFVYTALLGAKSGDSFVWNTCLSYILCSPRCDTGSPHIAVKTKAPKCQQLKAFANQKI